MTVKVTIQQGTQNIEALHDEHPEAVTFAVKDGHLLLLHSYAPMANPVAVYAPGQWVSANVVKQ